jgi:hypothetical protein
MVEKLKIFRLGFALLIGASLFNPLFCLPAQGLMDQGEVKEAGL